MHTVVTHIGHTLVLCLHGQCESVRFSSDIEIPQLAQTPLELVGDTVTACRLLHGVPIRWSEATVMMAGAWQNANVCALFCPQH